MGAAAAFFFAAILANARFRASWALVVDCLAATAASVLTGVVARRYVPPDSAAHEVRPDDVPRSIFGDTPSS